MTHARCRLQNSSNHLGYENGLSHFEAKGVRSCELGVDYGSSLKLIKLCSGTPRGEEMRYPDLLSRYGTWRQRLHSTDFSLLKNRRRPEPLWDDCIYQKERYDSSSRYKYIHGVFVREKEDYRYDGFVHANIGRRSVGPKTDQVTCAVHIIMGEVDCRVHVSPRYASLLFDKETIKYSADSAHLPEHSGDDQKF